MTQLIENIIMCLFLFGFFVVLQIAPWKNVYDVPQMDLRMKIALCQCPIELELLQYEVDEFYEKYYDLYPARITELTCELNQMMNERRILLQTV